MAVQFCGTCGHPLIPDQLFCQHCGSRIDENATRSGPPVTPGIPVSSVGTLYCGQCGALVGSQERACRRCGAPIEPSPGLVSDPSLGDVPTAMGTPPPPANQPSPAPWGQASPPPGYTPQPPPAWGASYSPAPANESPTFTVNAPRAGVQTPPPYRPGGPGRPPPRRGPRWPLVLAAVLVGLALIVGGGLFLVLRGAGGNPQTNGTPSTSTPGVTQTPTGSVVTPSPTPVVLTPKTASDLIQQFYAYINAKNYDAAYDLFSPEYPQKQSRKSFADGFQNTIHDTITIDSAEPQSDGTVQVNVHLKAEEMGGTRFFAGYYIVTKENEQLLILRAKINELQTSAEIASLALSTLALF